MKKVVHLTSVHSPFDNRILNKECATLVANGYNVVLIAPHDKDEYIKGVYIRSVKKPVNRTERILSSIWRIYRVALLENASIYHFHDPELIPIGILLRLKKKQVIYDVHEDYVTSIKQKIYLPSPVNHILAWFWNIFELWMSKYFYVVIAEKYYQKRLSSAVQILNYPILKRQSVIKETTAKSEAINLLYTGNVTIDRGALIHANLVNICKTAKVFFVGYCEKHIADKIYKIVGDNRDRIIIVGEENFVRYEKIISYYKKNIWTAGLALFPPTDHYKQKELTKLFEYMGYGIPIISSDFHVWRNLIDKNGCGICVNPEDNKEIEKAIKSLANDAELRHKMGINGQKAVIDKYNWESEQQRLIDFYKKILVIK